MPVIELRRKAKNLLSVDENRIAGLPVYSR
jgi:hypothetical protein